MDQPPSITFVGAVDANASIIDGNALLCANIDPAFLILHSHLSECRRELEAILPSRNDCPASWIIFCQCKEVEKVYIHEVVLMMKIHLDVKDPVLNVRQILETNIGRHVNKPDIKGYRLRCVSYCPRGRRRNHECGP